MKYNTDNHWTYISLTENFAVKYNVERQKVYPAMSTVISFSSWFRFNTRLNSSYTNITVYIQILIVVIVISLPTSTTCAVGRIYVVHHCSTSIIHFLLSLFHLSYMITYSSTIRHLTVVYTT